MHHQAKDYKDSKSYAATRLSREAVRRIGRKRLLTKTQCSILLRVVNLWHYHANGSGVIYPGCGATAKLVGCDRSTVIRAFERLREIGIMIRTGLENGGAGATRYVVDAIAIWKFSGLEVPEEVPGKLVEIHRYTENATGGKTTETRGKIQHDITNVRPFDQPQEVPFQEEIESDEIPEEISLDELDAYRSEEFAQSKQIDRIEPDRIPSIPPFGRPVGVSNSLPRKDSYLDGLSTLRTETKRINGGSVADRYLKRAFEFLPESVC